VSSKNIWRERRGAIVSVKYGRGKRLKYEERVDQELEWSPPGRGGERYYLLYSCLTDSILVLGGGGFGGG